MSRKILIVLVGLVVVIPPLSAWLLVNSTYSNSVASKNPDQHVNTATKGELLEAIKNSHKESHFYEAGGNEKIIEDITSFSVYDHWWYVVFVDIKDSDSVPLPMIVAKFYNGPDTIRIITNPGEAFPLHSISDMLGVPYDVIDKYNEALSKVAD